jgi:hypothetical protein
MSILERGPVTIFVAGRPRTKGSMLPERAAGNRVHMKESGVYSVAWKRTMILGIWEQCGITPLRRKGKIYGFDPEPYAGPVRVDGMFIFERERSVAVVKNGEVWESHDTPFPTANDIGDEDKLRRNLLDALTQSGLIKDDRYVVGPQQDWNWNGKQWASSVGRAGVMIGVYAA